MSDLKGMRVNAAVEQALEEGAGEIAGMGMDDPSIPLPPPWAHLVDEVLEVSGEDGRVSTHRGRPWMPWEIIL